MGSGWAWALTSPFSLITGVPCSLGTEERDLCAQRNTSLSTIHWNILPLSFFKNYLVLAVQGLRCCVGLSPVAVPGLLTAVASPVAEHRLWGMWVSAVAARGLCSCGSQALEHRLSGCGAEALLLCNMWDLPSPGIQPYSPTGRQILHHRTTREALFLLFLNTAPCGACTDSTHTFSILDRGLTAWSGYSGT